MESLDNCNMIFLYMNPFTAQTSRKQPYGNIRVVYIYHVLEIYRVK